MNSKDKFIKFKTEDLIKEHRRLVKVLKTKKGLKREEREQAKELKEYER